MGRRLTLITVAVAATTVVLLSSAVSQWIPGTDETLTFEAVSPPATRVRVDVRNAGGVSGMARAATDRLRSVGYDVVDFGNASSFDLDSSIVIDRVGDFDEAGRVARALGIPRIVSEPDSNLFVEVTVRLGADWSPESALPDPRPRGFWGRLEALFR